jgi:hypothetical protein
MNVIKEISDLVVVLGKRPTQKDASKELIKAARKEYGNWTKAVNKVPLDDILKEYHLSKIKEIGNVSETEAHKLGVNTKACRKLFGTWVKAKEAAGFNSLTNTKTDEELLDDLKRLYSQLGKTPSAQDMQSCGFISSYTVYTRRFGSIERARELAEVPGFSRREIFKGDALAGLAALGKELGRAPTFAECNKSSLTPAPSTLMRKFGSYKKALSLAGFEYRVSKQDLLDRLKELANSLSRTPVMQDIIDWNLKNPDNKIFGGSTYQRHFGSWANALEAAGLEYESNSISSGELEVLEFIKEHYSGEIKTSDRAILKPKELDIYIPDKALAIEYNGECWHSESLNKTKYNLLEKTDACSKLGISLIHVMENEWKTKQPIVKSRILNALGKSERLYARDCKIVELSAAQAHNFLEETHTQGFCNASVFIGLEYYEEIVAVMSFAKPRFNSKYQWELIRYSSELNTTIVGGASRLLKYFERKYKPTSIISYCDRRWGSGGLYLQLGFTESHKSKPNYFYYKSGKVFPRYKFQKHKLPNLLDNFDESKTEVENMLDNGYLRYFDCGNYVFVKEFTSQ